MAGKRIKAWGVFSFNDLDTVHLEKTEADNDAREANCLDNSERYSCRPVTILLPQPKKGKRRGR